MEREHLPDGAETSVLQGGHGVAQVMEGGRAEGLLRRSGSDNFADGCAAVGEGAGPAEGVHEFGAG